MARVLTQKVPFNNTAELTGGDWANATVLMDPATGLLTAPNNPGTGATSLGKAEDAPHTSGDTGVFILGVRNSSGALFTNTDLDYAPIGVNNKGHVGVHGQNITSIDAQAAALGVRFEDNGANSGQLEVRLAYFNGATYDMARTLGIQKTVALTAGTAETTIWTPAGGKKFRVMGGWLTASAQTVLTFKDNTAGTTILVLELGLNVPFPIPSLGNGVLSAAANNVLTVTRATSATLNGTLFGTEE